MGSRSGVQYGVFSGGESDANGKVQSKSKPTTVSTKNEKNTEERLMLFFIFIAPVPAHVLHKGVRVHHVDQRDHEHQRRRRRLLIAAVIFLVK